MTSVINFVNGNCGLQTIVFESREKPLLVFAGRPNPFSLKVAYFLHFKCFKHQRKRTSIFKGITMYANTILRNLETVKQGVTARPNLYGDHFSKILKQTMGPKTLDSINVASKAASDRTPGNIDRVPIGRLSEQNPSVSNLLIKHPVYGKDCWEIIHSPINRNKPFRNIGKGTSVYVDPKSREITWHNELKDISQASSDGSKPFEAKNDHQVYLGTLSKIKPTVSHLLSQHPAYGKDCWNILSDDLNRSKQFNTIPENTPVYLNTTTREITWGGQIPFHETPSPVTPPAQFVLNTQIPEPDPFSEKLVSAIKPYIGTSYHKINCFELLVHGLEEMGIQYRGPGGLGSRLIRRAMEKNLPENHYLSGEGLIETTGSLVYAKSVSKIQSSGAEASALYREIEPLLKEGQILSFSTSSRGHTGIVSRRENHWTYINSGNMDHQISGRTKKGVGEESLEPEIRNWFRLAAGSGETLSVTIGRLNEGKLRGITELGAIAGDHAI